VFSAGHIWRKLRPSPIATLNITVVLDALSSTFNSTILLSFLLQCSTRDNSVKSVVFNKTAGKRKVIAITQGQLGEFGQLKGAV
jgi:hypothetical protein